MMLVALSNVPETPEQWNVWSLNHRLSHDLIRQTLLLKGKFVNDYQLDPIFEIDILGFLQRNQFAHNEMNAALGTQGTDLQDIDLKEESAKVTWVADHFIEHQTAELALGIGS